MNQTIKLLILAILSRFFIWFVGWSSSFVIGDYDTSTGVMRADDETTCTHQFADSLIFGLVRPFVRWDGIYFMKIASKGYEFEQYHAFFPLTAMIIKGMAYFWNVILGQCGLLKETTVLAVSGFLLSNIAFIISTVYLYIVGVHVLRKEKMAFHGALLYCISPSNVFLSASGYTESLFSLCTFSGLVVLQGNDKTSLFGKTWIATILFALSGATRSTGFLNAGFIGFFAFKPLVMKIINFFVMQKEKGLNEQKGGGGLLYWLFVIIQTALQLVIICLPYLAFQWYGYNRYCINTMTNEDFPRPWCSNSIPHLYNFAQDKYWNVGFLRYYTLQQLPNFVLAGPILFLSFSFFSHYVTILRKGKIANYGLYSWNVLPFAILWLVLVFIGLTNMHVQVLTRALSPMPALFWFAAECLEKRTSKFGDLIVYYFVGFSVVGSILFSNFYPWT